MVFESLIGSALGGIFRLAPEVIKLLDRKNERAHEAAMLELELKSMELKLDQVKFQTDAAMVTHELDGIAAAIQEQGRTARKAGKVMAFISAFVRPAVTYWFVALYSAVKAATMILAYQTYGDWETMLSVCWNKDDMALLTMILTFWFVGRVYERNRK